MSAEEITEEKIVEASEEKPEEKKKERKFHRETRVITEAPKTRLITAFVMLLGGGFMAIFTLLQHYEIGAWIKTLLLSLAVFLVVGRFFELIVSHFDNLNRAKEDAILVQEEAIAQREADELAAAEAEAQAEAERLAAEEAAALADEETENQNTPNEYNPFGESDDFVVGEDFSEF